MFSLFRLVIWLTGIVTITYFSLRYLGYEINWNYWHEQKSDCQEKLDACREDLIKTGVEGAKKTCDIHCVDPKVLIKKQEAERKK